MYFRIKNFDISKLEWKGDIDVGDGCWRQFQWLFSLKRRVLVIKMTITVTNVLNMSQQAWSQKSVTIIDVTQSTSFCAKPTSLSSIIKLNSFNFRILNLILCYLIDGRITVIRFLTIFCWFWRFDTPVTRHNNPNNEIFCL